MENLTEEVLRDRDHVTELLFICEGKGSCNEMAVLDFLATISGFECVSVAAQRQAGDILLNEQSPQSHQITKLVCFLKSDHTLCQFWQEKIDHFSKRAPSVVVDDSELSPGGFRLGQPYHSHSCCGM